MSAITNMATVRSSDVISLKNSRCTDYELIAEIKQNNSNDINISIIRNPEVEKQALISNQTLV